MIVLAILTAGVTGLLRGRTDDLLVTLLMLAGGLALLAVLARRTVRGGYVMGVRRFGDLEESTTSVPYFVLDLVWLCLGAVWAYHTITEPDPTNPWLGHVRPATILVVIVLLLALRVRCRLRR